MYKKYVKIRVKNMTKLELQQSIKEQSARLKEKRSRLRKKELFMWKAFFYTVLGLFFIILGGFIAYLEKIGVLEGLFNSFMNIIF